MPVRFRPGPPLLLLLALAACSADAPRGTVVTFPGSALGAEGELLAAQVERFERAHPGVQVKLRRTPDAADQRHQLYVQWLAARVPDPDVLQLDVVWTAEFAAAGWIRPLELPAAVRDDFFPAPLAAARWRERLYALPWFVDVGVLYWRTDLLDGPPHSFEEIEREARAALERDAVEQGWIFQGARYEGLVTVFLELLAARGGAILDAEGRVVVDEEPAVEALTALRDAILVSGAAPREVLTWQEEPARLAFQNGRALFMRNWPYAHALLRDPEQSKVAGRFAVSPLPAAALGGQLLAVNTASDVPEAAGLLIEFLTAPVQLRERALRLGQLPPRRSLFDDPELADALAIPAESARASIERAVPRPVTPLWTELSQTLQVHLHRALSGQSEPREALAAAARELRRRLARAGLGADA